MEKLHAAHPKDVEVAAFYALALLARRRRPTDAQEPDARHRDPGAVPPAAARPSGVLHYLIHGYDYPPVAQKGLAAAQGVRRASRPGSLTSCTCRRTSSRAWACGTRSSTLQPGLGRGLAPVRGAQAPGRDRVRGAARPTTTSSTATCRRRRTAWRSESWRRRRRSRKTQPESDFAVAYADGRGARPLRAGAAPVDRGRGARRSRRLSWRAVHVRQRAHRVRARAGRGAVRPAGRRAQGARAPRGAAARHDGSAPAVLRPAGRDAGEGGRGLARARRRPARRRRDAPARAPPTPTTRWASTPSARDRSCPRARCWPTS